MFPHLSAIPLNSVEIKTFDQIWSDSRHNFIRVLCNVIALWRHQRKKDLVGIWIWSRPKIFNLTPKESIRAEKFQASSKCRPRPFESRLNTGCFLLCSVFDRASCLHFLSDLVHRPLIFFGRYGAVEWGIDHNCIIPQSRVISQCVKDVFSRKKDRFFDILLRKGW